MSNLDQLIEQQIRERESRLKHIDEMLDSVHQRLDTTDVSDDIEKELEEIRIQRESLENDIAIMKRVTPENWEDDSISRAGPMGVWDAIAQRLEKLAEHLDRKKS